MKRYERVSALMKIICLTPSTQGEVLRRAQQALATELEQPMRAYDPQVVKEPVVLFRPHIGTTQRVRITVSFYLHSKEGWDQENADFEFDPVEDELHFRIPVPRSRISWMRNMIDTIMDEEV